MRSFSLTFTMTPTRILNSAVAAMLCMGIAAPAFAATTEEILAEQKTFQTQSICEGRTERNLGKCIGDVLKRIKALRKEFTDALDVERKAWYDEHASLGVSTEYSKALQEFIAATGAKRKLFNDQQRVIEKLFFDSRKDVRENATTTTKTYTTDVNAAAMEAATLKCAKVSDARGLRLCLRQQLKLLDPTTRQLNMSPAGTRSN